MPRVLLALAGALALGACQSATAPQPDRTIRVQPLQPHPTADVVPASCPSGWSVANARCA